LFADLQRTVYPHKWSPVSRRSSAGQRKFACQRPTFYRCRPTRLPRNQPHIKTCTPGRVYDIVYLLSHCSVMELASVALSPVHTGDNVEFNTVDLVKPATNRQHS